MKTINGSDHLAWCKARAEQFLARGDHNGAWDSFVSDMAKHVSTREHPALLLGSAFKFMASGLSTIREVRDFIQGVN